MNDASYSRILFCVKTLLGSYFSRNCKKYCSPLPNLKHLKVMIHPELNQESELQAALRLCAPSLETLEIRPQIKKYSNYQRWYAYYFHGSGIE